MCVRERVKLRPFLSIKKIQETTRGGQQTEKIVNELGFFCQGCARCHENITDNQVILCVNTFPFGCCRYRDEK